MRRFILPLVPFALSVNLAAAQETCSEDCLLMVKETIRAAAQRHEFPLSEVVVDTTDSGYRNPRITQLPGESTRLVTGNEFVALSRDLGVGLGAREAAWSCEPARCEINGGSVLIQFRAPVIDGDAGRVRVMVGYGVDSPSAKGRAGYTYYARFLRENGVWRFLGLDRIGMS